MRVEDLDLTRVRVLVPVTKTKRHRVAPLSPEAVKLLTRYLRDHSDSGPLWIGKQGPLSGHPAGSAGRRGTRRCAAPARVGTGVRCFNQTSPAPVSFPG